MRRIYATVTSVLVTGAFVVMTASSNEQVTHVGVDVPATVFAVVGGAILSIFVGVAIATRHEH